MFTSKTPHFFKIILDETVRDGKLGIPRKFVRNYGNQLPSSIQLEVPSGAIWQVELTKSDEMVWIQKGWREFAEHYSVEFGHFLVFRYEGNAHFHVLIFDKSASEIEYSFTKTEDADDDDDEDLSVEICEDASASRKSREKTHLPCLRPHKKMRVDSPNQPEIDSNLEILSSPISADNLENFNEVEKSRCSTLQFDGISSPATKGVGGITSPRSLETEVLLLSSTQRLTVSEKARADQIASAFESTGNPAFMVVMKPSSVRYGCKSKMVIPSNFVKRFLKMQIDNLTLCDSTGKTWDTKFFRSSENKKPYAQIHGGWRAFVEDNNLNVGDICVFELIKQPGILLKVVIYPAVENANRPSADGNIASRVKIRSLDSDNEPNCRHSRRSTSSREFEDPKFKENEDADSDIEILDDFPLNQKTKKKLPSPCFQSCEFKSSAKDDSGGMSAARSCLRPDLMEKMKPLTETMKERACIRDSDFKSPNPSFTVRMQPSYVRTKGELVIPRHFARRYFNKNGQITLRVLDGKTWSVEYKIDASGRLRVRSTSWRAFVLDNNLKVGNVCVFELIKENEGFFEVHFSAAHLSTEGR